MKMIEVKQPTHSKITIQPTTTVAYPQTNNKIAQIISNNHQNTTSVVQYQISNQQQQNNSNIQEQQAKQNLYNWLKMCFVNTPSNQISKTELYCYYKYVAKLNNWITFSIPIFFELLQ